MAAGEFVTVACKLPHGLILRVFDMVEVSESVMGGGYRTAKVARERGEQFVVKGWSHPQNAAPTSAIVGGYAITPNIPKDFWELWLSQNKDADYVKNHLIFADIKQNSTEAQGSKVIFEKREQR